MPDNSWLCSGCTRGNPHFAVLPLGDGGNGADTWGAPWHRGLGHLFELQIRVRLSCGHRALFLRPSRALPAAIVRSSCGHRALFLRPSRARRHRSRPSPRSSPPRRTYPHPHRSPHRSSLPPPPPSPAIPRLRPRTSVLLLPATHAGCSVHIHFIVCIASSSSSSSLSIPQYRWYSPQRPSPPPSPSPETLSRSSWRCPARAR